MQGLYDIGIVGGGIVGASLGLALRDSPGGVVLIESQARPAAGQEGPDARALALSLASQRILERLGVWKRVAASANPIKRVHVSEQGRFGATRLDASLLGLTALGYVVGAAELGAVLVDEIGRAQGVDVRCPARVTGVSIGKKSVNVRIQGADGDARIRCKLLIAADGTHSPLRSMLGIAAEEVDYGQTALVAAVTARVDHADTAYERFTPAGPLALLPLRDRRCMAVFCVKNAELDGYLRMNDADFLSRIEARHGRRLGGFSRIGPRSRYPLLWVRPERQVAGRVVLMGNAAHTLHPNAAQGLNLALRGVAGLAERLYPVLRSRKDPGDAATLAAYVDSRVADQRRVTAFTDGLARLFYSEDPVKRLARNLGMLLVDLAPPLKRAMLRSATGLWGPQPAWVRGTDVL